MYQPTILTAWRASMIAILGLTLSAPTALAQDASKKKTTEKKTEAVKKPAKTTRSLPKFAKPPGKALRKTSAGTRGDTKVKVAILTPDTYGMTYSAQPSFFWYQSEASKPKQITFNLYEPSTFKKLAKVPLKKGFSKGINRLDLVSLKVKLTPGKTYEWSITYEVSRKNRSLNAVSKGAIKFVSPDAETAKKIKGADAETRAPIFAEKGAWHDLLGALDDQIKATSASAGAKKDPKKNELAKKERTKLLEQVGLGEYAK